MEQPGQLDAIIIGAGLTGLTTAFYLHKAGKKIRILEKNDRTGGQIKTFRENGFIFESGPNTGAVSHPEVAELFMELYPDCELETANEDAKRRLIWKGKKFHELPNGLWSGFTTPLFSWYDKFRIWGEPFRCKGTDPDEPVGALARRRLGKSYLDYAVDPFISGVYAGDPMKLTTRYALPKLYNLEQEYGSFIKGSIAKAKLPKTDRDQLATKKVFSAKGGLDNLVHTMTTRIGHTNITLSANNIEIIPVEGGWKVRYQLKDGKEYILEARNVITTTGAYTLPSLLSFISEEEISKVSNLKYAPIIQASVGVHDTDGLSFNAFGGLVPSCEKKEVLGILFPAACFEKRSPDKGALFSFFMGGVRHPDYLTKSDDELKVIILQAFHRMLKFPDSKKPDLIRIFRHERAIPQYDESSGERFAVIEKIQDQYPGLYLGGNIRNGIGMADRIKQGTQLAWDVKMNC